MSVSKPSLRLSWDQVLAFRLSKHHLDQRASKRDLVKTVGDICGVQSQLFSAAELGVWARVEGVQEGNLEEYLWKDRTLVKTWAMRGTLHLLPSVQLSIYSSVLGKTRLGWQTKSWQRYFGVEPDDIPRIISQIGNALSENCLTREELADIVSRKVGPHLRKWMLSGWGEFLKPVAYNGKLIAGPPRDGKATFVGPDYWLRAKSNTQDFDQSLRTILLAYLEAYGPATHEDFAHWWGFYQGAARKFFKTISGEIAQVDVEGQRAWMLTRELERIQKLSEVNSVRLLPSFDSYVLGFRPRELLVPKKHVLDVFRPQAWISPVILVNGKVGGTWELQKGKSNKITIKLFSRLRPAQRSLLMDEVGRLGEFLGRELSASFASP